MVSRAAHEQIRRSAYRSVAQLKAGIQDFIDVHHDNPKPFVWTKSADEILASIARFAQRTADARAATNVTNHDYGTLARDFRFCHGRPFNPPFAAEQLGRSFAARCGAYRATAGLASTASRAKRSKTSSRGANILSSQFEKVGSCAFTSCSGAHLPRPCEGARSPAITVARDPRG